MIIYLVLPRAEEHRKVGDAIEWRWGDDLRDCNDDPYTIRWRRYYCNSALGHMDNPCMFCGLKDWADLRQV